MNMFQMLRSNVTKAGIVAAAVSVVGGSTAVGSVYSDAVNALNPLSYWQFQEATGTTGTPIPAATVSDDAGSRNQDGAYFNGSSQVGGGIDLGLFPGTSGNNASVNFVSQNSIRGSDVGLPSGNSSRTWTGFVNFPSQSGSGYHDVFSYGTAAAGQQIFTLVPPSGSDSNLNGNPDVIDNFGVSQNSDGIGTNAAIDGEWHFLTWTATAGAPGVANFRLYVDGVFQVQKAMGTNTVLNGIYYIGDDSLSLPYFGETAQQAIFGAALNDAQITALYVAATTPVPEPVSAGILGLATAGLLGRRRRA